MISDTLLSLVRCPDCHGALAGTPDSLVCQGCGRPDHGASPDYLDLRPRVEFMEQTNIWTRRCTPTRGTSGCRRRFSDRGSGTTCFDRSCRSCRVTSSWISVRQRPHAVLEPRRGIHEVGIDISPYFAEEAAAASISCSAIFGSCRSRTRMFIKAFSLDVFEHLSPERSRACSSRWRACSRPAARCSFTRTSATLAPCPRSSWINALARQLERVGTHRHAAGAAAQVRSSQSAADFLSSSRSRARPASVSREIRYYSPIVGGFVENIMMRMAERAMAARRPAVRSTNAPPTRTLGPFAKRARRRRNASPPVA